MASYRLARRAVVDLEKIARYTIERFGVKQARQYREELKACFERLADNPKLGQRAEQLAAGLRQVKHQSPIVFYLVESNDLLIIRILHSRMDVPRHL